MCSSDLTATQATLGGFVTVHPSDVARPDASNLNWPGPGNTVRGVVGKALAQTLVVSRTQPLMSRRASSRSPAESKSTCPMAAEWRRR